MEALMIFNGAALLFIIGVYVAYRLACWAGEAPREGSDDAA